jgi:hypothetical protein
MEKLTVNESAKKERIEKAYEKALAYCKEKTSEGYKYFTIHLDLDHSESWEVMRKLEPHGVHIQNRGFYSQGDRSDIKVWIN